MIKMTRILMAVTAVCGMAYGAHAADLSQPRVINYPQAADPVAASGWYLRGDMGVGIVSQGQMYDSYIANPAAGQTTGWLNQSIGNTATVGVGAGYQFSDNLRGDVTLQYRAATSFQGTNYISSANGTLQNVNTGKTSSAVAMVNGYYDITHWGGLTPFIGAGVGVAFNQVDATSIQQGAGSEYGVFGRKTTPDLAWALHTGLSYDISSRLKLEMAYSYVNLGSAKSGGETCYTINCGGGSEYLKLKNLSSNDFHFGMRWMLDAPEPTAAAWQPASAPVVAKY